MKKVFKVLTNFTGQDLDRTSLFSKVARSATLLQKRLQHKGFSKNFVKFLRTKFHRTHTMAASIITCIIAISSEKHVFGGLNEHQQYCK